MLDLGWTELLVVGVVALIVVGPKDLPVLFRNVGRFMGKMRGMAREFTSAMNDAADETGVKGMASDLRKMTNPLDTVAKAARSATNFDLDPETGGSTETKKGPETTKLSAERLAAKKKIEAKSARMAAERKAREAADAAQKAEELEAALEASSEPTPADAPSATADETPKT
jgi:sec-independent protein translocase protein TatB